MADILESLPPPLSSCTTSTLLQMISDIKESIIPMIPDTYRLSTSKVLKILLRKVDALEKSLSPSVINEFVDKLVTPVLGQPPPENIQDLQLLAKRKCAFDFVCSNLNEKYTQLLYQKMKYDTLIH
jgi:Ydr279p protein family (RNase H2 complex component) wHTH domain